MDKFLILLSGSCLLYLIIFGLPYLIFWRRYSSYFKQYKIQVVPRQAPQILLELRYSAIALIIRSGVFWFIWQGRELGYFKIHTSFGEQGLALEIMAVAVYFLIYDGYFYWTHRLLHWGWLYKKIHVIHHKSLNPTPLAAYSFHPLETILGLAYLIPFVYFVSLSLPTFILLILLTDLGNLAGHLGFEFLPRRTLNSWWGSWLTSPTHHNLHHQFSRSNYGLYWSGWDKKFKTHHPKTEIEFYRIKDQLL